MGEKQRVDSRMRSSKPPDLGRTVVVRWDEQPAANLDRIRDVWRTVASWGTWKDEQLGDFPSVDDALNQLPRWMRGLRGHDFWDAWLDDVHDREWSWWGAELHGNVARIDLNCESLPMSTFPLVAVVELTGGEVLYQRDWLTRREFGTRFSSEDQDCNDPTKVDPGGRR